MRLTHLRYFVAVCESQSITKAAEKQMVSQPSVTVAMRNLENELGVSLFNRAHNRICLTEEGTHFYTKVKEILNDLDDLVNEMYATNDLKRTITIGSPPMISSFLLPEVLTFLNINYPLLTVDVIECGTIELEQLLLNEKIDFAIMLENEQSNPSITYYPILNTYDNLYVSAKHPLYGQTDMKLEDLQQTPLILFDKGFQINKTIMKSFEERHLTPNVMLETLQVHTVKNFIHKGIAAGFLIKECVNDSDGLKAIPLDVEYPITISIALKKSRDWYQNNIKIIKSLNKYLNRN